MHAPLTRCGATAGHDVQSLAPGPLHVPQLASQSSQLPPLSPSPPLSPLSSPTTARGDGDADIIKAIEAEQRFQHRGLDSTLDELGRALLNIVTMVPGGVVVFFPSYDYEKTVHGRLTSTGLLARLEAKKRIYREPKSTAELDKVLADYATSVRLAGGALLLAVVGGKMSEGINFSDDLGRAVVMVGLPYPKIGRAHV